MPVAAIPGDEAYRNLKRSRTSLWPDERVGDQRLSGLVRLDLQPSFGFSRDDRIMTLGSCFARGLENRLDELGFDVPMKRACGRPSPVVQARFNVVDEFPATERGAAGYGSTGKA